MHQCGPFAFDIDSVNGIVTVVPSSVPTPDDYTAVLEAIARHPDFRPGLHILSDRRGLRGTPPTINALRWVVSRVAAVMTAAWPGARVAVLVENDATFGTFRVAEVHFEDKGVALRVFRHEDAAKRWLTTGDDSDT
jgi:hypothetical protein